MLTLHLEKLDKVGIIKVSNKFAQKTTSLGHRIKLFRKFIKSDLDNILRISKNFEWQDNSNTNNRK